MKLSVFGALLALTISLAWADAPQHLLLSTDAFVSLSGGVSSAEDEDAVLFEVVSAEPGGTDGFYSTRVHLDMSDFGVTASIDALHYVKRRMHLFTTESEFVDGVPAGSLLVSFDTDNLVLPVHPSLGSTINNIDDEDINLFIPDTPGDYTVGTWVRFFDGADSAISSGPGLSTSDDQNDIDALCLVEQDVTVGGVNLLAGDLILSTNGLAGVVNARAEDLIVWRGTRFGSTTQGAWVDLFGTAFPDVLFDGGDELVEWPGPPDESIEGVHLLTQETQIGDEILPGGTLLLTIQDDGGDVGNPSDITPNAEDVFAFFPTSLESGGLAVTDGSFADLLVGSSTAMGLASVGVDAFTLVGFPALSAEISATDLNGGDLMRGDRVAWTVQIRNHTQAHASSVEVAAPVPSHSEGLEVTSSAGGTVISPEISLHVKGIHISPETTVTLSFETSVEASAGNGDAVNLSGGALAAAEGGEGTALSHLAGIVLVIEPDVSASTLDLLDLNGGDVTPGDTLRFVLTLTNSASQEATGIDVSGEIDAATESLSVTGDGGGIDLSTASLLDLRDLSVPSLGSTAVSWEVQVKADAGQAEEITMTVTTSQPAEGGTALSLDSNPLFTIPAELTLFATD